MYLFIGEDELSKKRKLDLIKKENFSTGFDKFNFQVFFAQDLELHQLQEYFLKYPFKEKKLIFIIKEIERLSPDIKKFILSYIKSPSVSLILVLDVYSFDGRDDFINTLANNNQIKVFNFKRSFYPSVFSLSRLINQKKTQEALNVLNELIIQKTKPEKILGGLRYQWEKEPLGIEEKTKRFNMLLEADVSIKRGAFSPGVALETLLVKLCALYPKPEQSSVQDKP